MLRIDELLDVAYDWKPEVGMPRYVKREWYSYYIGVIDTLETLKESGSND